MTIAELLGQDFYAPWLSFPHTYGHAPAAAADALGRIGMGQRQVMTV
jgi:hypothetical protein